MSVVGIDLGTTNTVVGCVRAGKVHVLADEKGVRLLPSVVSFHPNGEVLVGASAKARRTIDAKNTIYSHKRLIGRSWGSPEITQARARFAFELREGPGQGPLVHARNQDYTLPEISAFVLKRARQIAEAALGTPVERAVITVPAHFNELQRASTKVAGRVSGLEVLRILNEPTAAALAYGLGRTGNERVAVYDFGGGTFDCTLLDLNGNVFEVLATAGDSFLGGDDIDNLIADRMAETFLKQHRQDAREDPQLYERLKTTAEDVKIALSTAETHTVVLKDFGHGAGGGTLNFSFTMTRKDFDAMITPLVERSFKVTQDALALARLTPSSFDKVILVGGSTRVPLVRRRVESFFGGPPMDRVNPDEVVAIGAAIQAAALTEGIRRRSLPAPPGLPHRPSQSDTQDNSRHSRDLDAATLKPAFGSEPPTFGFSGGIATTPPDRSGLSTGAPPMRDPFQTRPPNPADVAASTPSSRPTDPSTLAHVADVAAATSASTSASARPATTTARGLEPPRVPALRGSEPSFPSASTPGEAAASRDAAGPPTQKGVGPAAGSEPRTLTQATAVHDGAKTKASESSLKGVARRDASETHDDPPSLVSTTGVTLPGTARTISFALEDEAPRPGPSKTGTDPLARPTTSPMDRPQVHGPRPGPSRSEPRVPVERADLPASVSKVAAARSPHAPGGPARDPASSMTGRAPPALSPQPFGPMERIDEGRPKTAPMAAVAPPAPPAPQAKPHATTKPMRQVSSPELPAQAPGALSPRVGQPSFARTAPLGQTAPGQPPQPAPPSIRRTGQMQAVAAPPPPTPPPFASAPPPQAPPPQAPPPFASAPPPQAQHQPFTFGSSPPAMPAAGGGYGGSLELEDRGQPFGAFADPRPREAQRAPAEAQPTEAPSSGGHPPVPTPTGGPPPHYQAPLLVDVTPRALVVETAGGYTDTIIPRNAKIPCERTRRFATGRDMQTTVRVRVAQGEAPYFPQNTYLGEVELSGLRPAARGEVTVAVTFEVDADGTLRIRARDVQTGQEARATLQLIGIADESSVVMMINRFAQQPVVGGPTQ